MNTLFTIFALESAADGYTTFQIIRFGGHELDPILARAIKSLGLYWALMLEERGCQV